MGDISRICAGRFDRSILTKLSSLKIAGEETRIIRTFKQKYIFSINKIKKIQIIEIHSVRKHWT